MCRTSSVVVSGDSRRSRLSCRTLRKSESVPFTRTVVPMDRVGRRVRICASSVVNGVVSAAVFVGGVVPLL